MSSRASKKRVRRLAADAVRRLSPAPIDLEAIGSCLAAVAEAVRPLVAQFGALLDALTALCAAGDPADAVLGIRRALAGRPPLTLGGRVTAPPGALRAPARGPSPRPLRRWRSRGDRGRG